MRRAAARGLSRAARRLGYDLVRRNFYSPIPALDELPPDVFDRRSRLSGIDFDLDACAARLRELGPHLAEFQPPPGFSWGNGRYDRVEADVLHALIRHHKPRRILELGSGFSSLLIGAAAAANRREGHPVSYVAADPFALDFIREGVDGMDELRLVSAVDVPLEEFGELGDGDILFVDTTHTVKLGSEVNYIVLDVLPTLKPGVIVHVHDVVLPYEYPRSFFDKGLYWAEQYLLQAFLALNPDYEIVLPLFALVKERPDVVGEVVKSFDPDFGPGAFWMRRRA